MPTDLRRALGATGEDLAAAHLQRLGHLIVARNHRTRYGELDIVTCSGDTLVFVEVKTRRQSVNGSPWDALHERKRMQVRKMASAYLSDVTDRPRTREIRFDAIGIVIDGRGELVRLDHLEAAF
ncbi:MAG: YraN family protein [Solirubrobacterales bacterium]|nr:YraN family protein [Solirubrobacterales bacterium]